MNRRTICTCLLAFGIGPAFAQQPTPSPRTRLRAIHAHASSGSPAPPAHQAWTTDYALTPDTGVSGHSSIYDSATGRMIVFGGLDYGAEATVTNAVLQYSPAAANWTTEIASGAPGAPPARTDHTAVYDAANNRMIVFGGFYFAPGVETFFNDVWILSDANGAGSPTWAQLNPSGTPPAARADQTAVYDPANNRMIIFGGNTATQTFSDVWVLTDANGLGGTPAWMQLAPAGKTAAGVESPSAVYDPVNNIMTVFGGANLALTATTNGVWTLSHANGMGGTPRWTNIVAPGAAGSPGSRYGHTAVYDAASNRMIVFGGAPFKEAEAPNGFNDTWVLTNANGLGGTPVWTQQKPGGPLPDKRWLHSGVYDAVNNRMLVFAGEYADPVYYLVWILSDANGL